MKGTILIVDDERGIRSMLEIFFKNQGYKTYTEKSCKGSIAILREVSNIDVVITDLVLPDGDGIEILKFIKEINPSIQVIVITAYGTTQSAVNAMKLGAYDFIEKPFDIEELSLLVEKAIEKKELLEQNKVLREEITSKYNLENIIAYSPQMRNIVEIVKIVAPTPSNILITGESGTGKEVIARAIHNLSQRSSGKFVAINCGAIPKELMESELFGYVRGAFTGAVKDKEGLFKVANGGTIFLDEIVELPLDMQVKLLRVLQEKSIRPVGGNEEIKVDVRVIAATNKNLKEEVRAGRFRNDLFYRLNIINIELPPLRERREDIPYLINHFLKLYTTLSQKKIDGIEPKAFEFLLNYNYPGNVRELENMIERGVTLCKSGYIQLEDLIGNFSYEVTPDHLSISRELEDKLEGQFNLDRYLEEIEHKALIKALDRSGWNKTKAAKLLGISFRSLRYRLKKFGLDDNE